MSRVGNEIIEIPVGVSVNLEGSSLSVQGPKGQLEIKLRPEVKVEIEGVKLTVLRKKDGRVSRSMHGLTRSLINNMVIGVSQGWSKNIELVGIGYRVAGGSDSLSLSIGFSHPVSFKAPEGITFSVLDNNKVEISGIDKILVGQVAANIRKLKKPEPYKGKGIRYAGEYVRRKQGKAAAGAK